MPRSVYQRMRSSIQRWCHCSASSRRHEELDLHLLELARAEDEVARRDLVAERLADLRDPERRLLARELEHVLEVDEDALRGLGAQEDAAASSRTGPMKVSNIRLNWRASPSSPPHSGARTASARLGVLEVVRPPALLALARHCDQRVGEALQVAGRLPGARVHQDRRVEGHHVVALLDHRPPPLGLDVVLQQHAVVAVVVGGGEPAVDLRGLEDEAAPLAQGDDLVHGHLGGAARFRWLLRGAGHRSVAG